MASSEAKVDFMTKREKLKHEKFIKELPLVGILIKTGALSIRDAELAVQVVGLYMSGDAESIRELVAEEYRRSEAAEDRLAEDNLRLGIG